MTASSSFCDQEHSQGCYAVDYTMHATQRERLVKVLRANEEVGAKAVCLFQGGKSETRHETDFEVLFRQESSFQYLFGVKEPDCYAAIDVDSGEATLFVPRFPEDYATWMGVIHPPLYFRDLYKFDNVAYVDQLKGTLTDHCPAKVLLSRGYNHDGDAWAKEASFEGIEAFQCDRSTLLYDVVVELRVIKTPEEIKLLRHVNNISSDAHIEVMRQAKPGMGEYQLESLFRHHVYYNGGCRNQAYTSICGCGPNSAALHYGHAGAPNDRIIQDGDMLLLDMGGEYHCYISDITCSFPANGVFTADQRLIFETVAEMQFRVMDAMKPGVHWKDMHELSYRVACEKLKEGGLLQGDVEDMMAANVGGFLMPHGLGHFIGLDTHDVGGYPAGAERDTRLGYKSLRCMRELRLGMAITVEPGIYFIDHLLDKVLQDEGLSKFFNTEVLQRFRGFGGVRLEDDVVITEDGIDNLTNCPRTVNDVEAVISGKVKNRSQLFKKC